MQFLLKFLLIAILVIWILRVLARFLFPWAMRKAAEKIMKDGQQQQKSQQRKADGKVRIDYVPPKQSDRKGPQKAGEFIDFEEVETN